MLRRAARAFGLLALAGCAGTVEAIPAGNAWPPPTPEPSGTAVQPAPVSEPEPTPAFVARPRTEEDLVELTCADAPLAGGFGLVGAAAGTRVLRLNVRNCTDEPIDLTAPTLTGLDSSRHEVFLTTDAPAGGALKPHVTRALDLHWPTNGRCERGVQRLTVHLAGQVFVVEDCLQLGGHKAPERDVEVTGRWSS